MDDASAVATTVATADLPSEDESLLARLDPALARWWVDTFGDDPGSQEGVFTPPQREAIPAILDDENVLVAAPTGSGKTLTAFCAVIDTLLETDRAGSLEDGVYCLYVSPLRSLANDIQRNLETPLRGVQQSHKESGGTPTEIRHAIRHGDTDQSARQAMLEEPPHILNTTPETLAILLNAPKFRERLRSVEYVIVDEIHSLADDKRGSHLAVSLERLERMAEQPITRIGCSATVEPLDTMADFLVGVDESGTTRERRVVDCRFIREYDLELRAPKADLLGSSRDSIRNAMYDELHNLISAHETTIVFTNTRSGSERVLHQLRERFGAYTDENSACHHGSLSTAVRLQVEEGLKSGEFDVVTTSTSLELGIDMPRVDLVVQLGSPKSVSALLQRFGRAGHSLDRTVTGRVFALDRDELRECAVMLDRASAGFIDRLFVPECPLDVAIQHIYGMAIAAVTPESEIRQTLEAAYPFRSLTDDQWEQLMRYLTADYTGLEERHVYAKIWRDENDPPGGAHHYPEYPVGERLIGKRGRLARMIYMTNIGTIPDSFSCNAFIRADDEWVGALDEEYLDTLEPGDVFLLGGERFAFRYRRGGRVYVDRTDKRPTVPSWYSERLPLSYDLGCELAAWQESLLEAYESDGPEGIRRRLETMPIDERAAEALTTMFLHQVAYAGGTSVSTPQKIVIEEELDRESYERRYYIHSPYGRRFNDGFSRLLASECAEATDANVSVAVADSGFSLSMPLNRKVDLTGLVTDLGSKDIRSALRAALADTELLKRYFRMNATRSLMILTRYKGHEKSAREQQVSSEMLLGYVEALDDFAVIDETYRELLEDKLTVSHIESFLEAVIADEISVIHTRVGSPSPFAFSLAALSASDVVLAGDESAALKDFHRRVLAAIDDEDTSTDSTR